MQTTTRNCFSCAIPIQLRPALLSSSHPPYRITPISFFSTLSPDAPTLRISRKAKKRHRWKHLPPQPIPAPAHRTQEVIIVFPLFCPPPAHTHFAPLHPVRSYQPPNDTPPRPAGPSFRPLLLLSLYLRAKKKIKERENTKYDVIS